MPEKKPVPVVRARNRGQITTTLEMYSTAYKSQFPDRTTRYVYDPEHKPELSGVMGRKAMGYRLVKYHELGMDVEGMNPEATVRVADLVLMSIERARAKELVAENNLHAREALGAVQRKFYEDTEQLGEATKSKESSRPGTRPIGSTSITEKSFEYDIEQRGGDG